MTTSTVLVTGAGSGIGRAIAESLAVAGHRVYASMRDIHARNAERRDSLLAFARDRAVSLEVIELDVGSEPSCRAAVDQVLSREGRLDVLVNNAGMLMHGIGEAFTPEQFARILDTNAISWLRVNRAVLPVMRRQGKGLVVYVGSTTARVVEPFMATYVASKAAAEALAESMSFEIRPFGIESTVVVPGAFTEGTEHFAHSQLPGTRATVEQYGDVARSPEGLAGKLQQIDADNGSSHGVVAVGDAVTRLLELDNGKRPGRIVIDPQEKGLEDINTLVAEKQKAFLTRLGLDRLF